MESEFCVCVPCTHTTITGLPGNACENCMNTGVAEYGHDCPIEEHGELAFEQFGPWRIKENDDGESNDDG